MYPLPVVNVSVPLTPPSGPLLLCKLSLSLSLQCGTTFQIWLVLFSETALLFSSPRGLLRHEHLFRLSVHCRNADPSEAMPFA